MHNHEPTKEKYTCPMHPEIQQQQPGSCPQCGMALVKTETKADHSAHAGQVMRDPSKMGYGGEMIVAVNAVSLRRVEKDLVAV